MLHCYHKLDFQNAVVPIVTREQCSRNTVVFATVNRDYSSKISGYYDYQRVLSP